MQQRLLITTEQQNAKAPYKKESNKRVLQKHLFTTIKHT